MSSFTKSPGLEVIFIHVAFIMLIKVKMPKVGCNFFLNVILSDIWIKAINTALLPQQIHV